jgi:ELMO domain-containing protein
VDSLS